MQGILKYNHKETTNTLKLKNILYNNWPVIFKTIKVMKTKEILRNPIRSKETKDNTRSSSKLAPFAKMGRIGAIREV